MLVSYRTSITPLIALINYILQLYMYMINLINQTSTSNIYYFVVSDEMGRNRKLLSPDQRCKRGKIHYNLHEIMPDRKASNNPRCHHYL